jgi:hypothetical protein
LYVEILLHLFVYLDHLIIFVAILTVVPTIVQHQSFAQQAGEPKSTVVNSKYLTIKDLVYTNEDPTSTINGTVVNNSPVQISSAEVFAMLYDKNNSLITAGVDLQIPQF